MVQFLPPKSNWGEIGQGLGQGASEQFENRADQMAIQKAVESLPEKHTPRELLDALTKVKTYKPEARQQFLKNYLGVEEFSEKKRSTKANEDIEIEKNRIAALGKKTAVDVEKQKESLLEDGMPDYEADLYLGSPPGVQNRIMAAHLEAKARGLRQPVVQKPPESLPVNPNAPIENAVQGQEGISPESKEAPIQPEFIEPPVPGPTTEPIIPPEAKEKIPKSEWPDVPAPKETTSAEREKWRSKNQTENNKILKEIKPKVNGHTNSLLRYGRLKTLNDSKKLPEGAGRLVINPETSEPYAAASLLGLVNKETQDFVKTMNDFLIDAKSYFGARVTNFDIGAFKSRLPTLLNTEDGRRLIIEQMKLMEELQLVHDKTLEEGLKHYGRNASYTDIQRIVDEKTAEKEEKIIAKINNLDKASDYLTLMNNDPKFKDTVLMQNEKTGAFKAVPKNDVNKAKSKGYISW